MSPPQICNSGVQLLLQQPACLPVCLSGSPRIWLFVLQHAGCRIHFHYMSVHRGFEIEKLPVCVRACVCERDIEQEGKPDCKHIKNVFLFYFQSDFEILSSAVESLQITSMFPPMHLTCKKSFFYLFILVVINNNNNNNKLFIPFTFCVTLSIPHIFFSP